MNHSKIEALTSVEQDLKFITEGLKAKLTFAFDKFSGNSVTRAKTPDYYNPASARDANGNLITTISHHGEQFLDIPGVPTGVTRVFISREWFLTTGCLTECMISTPWFYTIRKNMTEAINCLIVRREWPADFPIPMTGDMWVSSTSGITDRKICTRFEIWILSSIRIRMDRFAGRIYATCCQYHF